MPLRKPGLSAQPYPYALEGRTVSGHCQRYPDSMVPCIVLDTETTGFPSKDPSGFRARVIEVGAVVVTREGQIVSPISFLVRQPREHLECWQAQQAMSVHGIGAEEILAEGLDPSEAAPRFARWVTRVRDRYGVREARAYNQAFDFWFLEQRPWSLFQRTGLIAGEDIQVVAARHMGRRRPGLARAVRHCQEQGAPFAWMSRAHRAGEDARMAAAVALFMDAPPASGSEGDTLVA